MNEWMNGGLINILFYVNLLLLIIKYILPNRLTKFSADYIQMNVYTVQI